MKELLPVLLGVLVAALSLRWKGRRRAVVFPVTCVLTGAFASAVNGELASEGWMFFVSFDALLVWAAATVALSAQWWVRRVRAVPGRA